MFKLLLPVCLMILVGCGFGPQTDYSKVELIDVSGNVTINGEPLGDAIVSFESLETGATSYGLTDSNGKYHLQFDSEKSGTQPGEKLVRISTTQKVLGINSDSEETGEANEEGATNAAPEEQVPDSYNRESKLKVVVTPSDSDFDFEIES